MSVTRRRFVPMVSLALAVGLCAGPVAPPRFERGDRLRERSKNSDRYRETLADASAEIGRSVARVFGGDDQAALGTVVGPGEVLTKASELSGDLSVLLPDTDERRPATLAGVAPQQDLALLRFDAGDNANAGGEPVAFRQGPVPVGTFLVSPGPGAERLGYGVVGVERLSVPKTSAFLGIGMEDQPGGGVVVRQVTPYSAAERAGLEPGDVILKIGGRPLGDRRDLIQRIVARNVGDVLAVTIARDGGEQTVRAILGSRPQGSERAIEQNQLGSFFSLRAANFPAVIQHDAVLLPDDMGGPVTTLDGEVVGVNIARAGRVETFALPADVVAETLAGLRAGKYSGDLDETIEPGDLPAEPAPMSGEQ